MDTPTALVMGAGDSLGAALARRFAREGMKVCVARRNADQLTPLVAGIRAAGGQAHAFGCDARKEDQVVVLFEAIEREHGPLGIVVFNIGANIQTMSARRPRRSTTRSGRWPASPASSPGARRRGTWRRGAPALAQSMAREFGKQGLHIVHPVIDGPIDTPFIRGLFPELVASRPADGLLAPDDIADTYWFLHKQNRSAWTFELDLRPWLEPIVNF